MTFTNPLCSYTSHPLGIIMCNGSNFHSRFTLVSLVFETIEIIFRLTPINPACEHHSTCVCTSFLMSMECKAISDNNISLSLNSFGIFLSTILNRRIFHLRISFSFFYYFHLKPFLKLNWMEFAFIALEFIKCKRADEFFFFFFSLSLLVSFSMTCK